MLQSPQFDEQFVLQTDASDTGVGAMLLQVTDGEERVLEFASHTLTPAERNYSVTEREREREREIVMAADKRKEVLLE